MKRAYALVFAVALAARLVAASKVALLDRDGVWYLTAASFFAEGDGRAGLAFHYPPLYPALAAVAERLGLGPEPAGLAVSAFAGALGAVFAAAIARRKGERAAWVAGLTVALHPASVELGCAVTADAVFATLLLGALLAAERARWATAGLLAAASYLARPEGIVAVLVLALRARRRAPRVAAAAALLVVPYMIAIKPEPIMTGHGAGSWKLSRKREVLLETGVSGVSSVRGAAALAEATGEKLARQLYWVGHSGKELLVVLAVLLAARIRSGGRRGPRGVPDLDVPLALLLTYALFHVDQRYGTIALTLVLPWLGAWLADLARPRWLLAVALLVPLLPATRARHTVKVTWREAGVLCTGHEKIASEDPRVAFYAHAPVFLDLHAMSLDEARARGAEVAVVRDDGDFAVSVPRTRAVIVDHPGERVEPVRIVPLK